MRHRYARVPFVPVLIAALITSSVTPLPSSAQGPNPADAGEVDLPDEQEVELPEEPEVEEPAPPEVDIEPAAVIATPTDARTHGLESLRQALAADGGVPLPSELAAIVRDRGAAIALGKALFWDMQVGSDGVMSCATCHFQAGADSRARNAMNPDLLRVRNERNGDIRGFSDAAPAPDTAFSRVGPDQTLKPADFPFVRTIEGLVQLPDGTIAPGPGNTNDVASSMGVFFTRFNGTRAGHDEDRGTRLADPVFNVRGTTVRRVEPRNTPTVINAVLNFANFWDGRANNVFNGVNPFGRQDPAARVWALQPDGSLAMQAIALENASLASQAVGPPLSHFEMSFGNPDIGNARTFPELGKKLLRGRVPIKPLAKQLVDRSDSVLGPLSAHPRRGLTRSYRALIRQAFDRKFWAFRGRVDLTTAGIAPGLTAGQPAPQVEGVAVPYSATGATGTSTAQDLEAPDALDDVTESSADAEATSAVAKKGGSKKRPMFTQMEANFALFFGISVMLYEATLVSDQTPFDTWMESGQLGGGFDSSALAGLNLFTGKGGCVNCHGGPELTNASVRNAQRGNNLIEPMLMARGTALYDNGFYNIGVVPTTDDPGRGGKDLNGKPLAFSRQTLFERVLGLSLGFPITGDRGILAIDELGNGVCTDANANGLCEASEPFTPGFRRAAVDGAFKTPGLRNQVFMGPYMHNGGLATLRQVVEFYNRGGNFCRTNLADLDPDIEARELSDAELDQLVSFLLSLTDERVRLEKAPFDHPELFIPDRGADERGGLRLSPVGKDGVGPAAALRPFLDLNPRNAIYTPPGVCSKE